MVSLYPNLDPVSMARIAADSVRETKVNMSGINYMFLIIYLTLVLGEKHLMKHGLGHCLPKRMTGNNSNSLAGEINRDLRNWDFKKTKICKRDKVELVALMVQIMVLLMTRTTCYRFGGKIFRQRDGLGIGLRGSAALARLAMCKWDVIWATMQNNWNLIVHLFCRYVDDLRVMLPPLNPGWFWTDHGWRFDNKKEDARDPTTRTVEEITKSMNSVWKFIKFTSETESDFLDGFLPTLDFATHVESNGHVSYKFFTKPMASNLVLQIGTALSKGCVFSSLRQDLVRRLLNSDLSLSVHTRMEVVNEYIQLLVNSGHKFQYIKSVVLQGLSKFVYMVQRSKLNKDNVRYAPLHRHRNFDCERRKLIKYTSQGLWYSDVNVKDEYRNNWKRWIKRKGWKNINWNRRHSTQGKNGTPVTSVCFVPKTENAELIERLQAVEDNLQRDTGWKTKLVERPGAPLKNIFVKRFPMLIGCARGDSCGICMNDGIGCTVKRVVYKASCKECKSSTYIGETARQVGTRVSEHSKNVFHFRRNSFIISHWMENHGTTAEPPEFEFKIVSSHRDPLGRQLKEAVMINVEGNLNRKKEFSINELIRLETSKYSWEEDIDLNKQKKEEQEHENKLTNFICVMSSVKSLCNKNYIFTDRGASNVPISRQRNSKRGGDRPSDIRQHFYKRIKMMTSTPLRGATSPDGHAMETCAELGGKAEDIMAVSELVPTPVLNVEEEMFKYRDGTTSSSHDGSNNTMDEKRGESDASQQDAPDQKNYTGLSGGTEVLTIDLGSPEQPEIDLARKVVTLNNYSDASDSFMKRVTTPAGPIRQNVVLGGLMDENTRDQYIATVEAENTNFQTWADNDKLYDGEEVETTNDEERGNEDIADETYGLEVLFQEHHIDHDRVDSQVKERSKNLLYDIFLMNSLCNNTPVKRKFSPNEDSVHGRFEKRTMELHNSPTLRLNVKVARPDTPSRDRAYSTSHLSSTNQNKLRKKVQGRKRINSLGGQTKGQLLMTDLLRKVGLGTKTLKCNNQDENVGGQDLS